MNIPYPKTTIAVITIIMVSCMVAENKPGGALDNSIDPLSYPRNRCMRLIKERLHDPAAAEFDGYLGWPAKQLPNGTFEVHATFRAKNGFGALRVGTAKCMLTQNGDKWSGSVDIK